MFKSVEAAAKKECDLEKIELSNRQINEPNQNHCLGGSADYLSNYPGAATFSFTSAVIAEDIENRCRLYIL